MLRRGLLFLLLLLLAAGCASIPIVITATPDYVTATPDWYPTDTATATATNTHSPTATNTATAMIEPTPTREVLSRDCRRTSYNINGAEVPDVNYLLEHLEQLDPCVVLVMDNIGLAVGIKRLLDDAIVIHRDFNRAEGEEWLERSTQEFVGAWRSQGHPEIVRYATNEPSLFNLTGFIQSERDLMRAAREADFTVCVGNFGVGRYQPGWIDGGLFDDYLRDIERYGHYLCPHEYTNSVLAFGFGQMPREWLLDRERMQPEHWSRDLPVARIPYPVLAQGEAIPFGLEEYQKLYGASIDAQGETMILPPYWHLRRADWFLIRADEIGVARPRIIIGEAFWDNMNDISDVISELKARFGLAEYLGDLRGINSYRRLWADYFPQWTLAETACQQVAYADEMYPQEYVGFLLFTWSRNIHWISFDTSGRQGPWLYDLHDMLERGDCAA